MRNIFRFLFFIFALSVLATVAVRFWPQIRQTKVLIPGKIDIIPIIGLQNQSETSLPDWTSEELLKRINDFREAQKLAPLSLNEKLSNAAKSRLAVLMEYSDFDGEQTGLTREKALDNVGYKYSWVGDLSLIDFFKVNNPISYWETIKNSSLTLKDKNLREVGIALKQTPEQVNAYVMLATQGATAPRVVTPSKVSWGGPELWKEINKRRVELGVNPLSQRDELCTIAAIRLNQTLDLGKLDGHAGFESTLEREDLKWISEKYNISEFLVSGYKTPQESVSAWENTLGHKKLLTGGEYVWGCVYAQSGFGVAIAAY